jgi:phosphopantetheinyl transferase
VTRVGTEKRTEAFLRYWTVKEAYAKALGVGLALDLREIGV